MKYKAIIDTDDFKDFKFFEDGIGKYMVGKDANATHDGWIPLYFEEVEKESVLDKIIAEIKALSPKPTVYDVVDGNPIKDAVWETIADVLAIIDKHKGESGE